MWATIDGRHGSLSCDFHVLVDPRLLGGDRTFFRGTNVHLIQLVPEHVLPYKCKHPSYRAETRSLHDKAQTDNRVDDWVGQEGNWERRGNDAPCKRSDNCGDDGPKQSSVEALLDSVADSKDGVLADPDITARDASDKEHGKSHTHLSANQESLQVGATESKLAALGGHGVLRHLVGRQVHNSKQGNLHTLHHTDKAQKDEQDDNGNDLWNSSVHGSLAVVESRQSHGEREAQGDAGEGNTSPEQDVLDAIARGLVRLDGSVRDLGEYNLDEVHRMQETRLIKEHRTVCREHHEVCVDKVKHAIGSVDLSRLTNHDSYQGNGNTRAEEALDHSVVETKDGSILDGRSNQVRSEDNQNNQELTSDDESLHVVTLVGQGSANESSGVAVSIEGFVNGLETN